MEGGASAARRLTEGPTAGPRTDRPSSTPADVRAARLQSQAAREAAGPASAAVVADATDLADVFEAGVTPAELAAHLDPATLSRLVPQLSEADAHEVSRLFAEPRVRAMLDDTWASPPDGHPMLAEVLVRQLTEHVDLVRILHASPELSHSLLARPLTLHHLASHQQAIDVLGSVVDGLDAEDSRNDASVSPPDPVPTPLKSWHVHVSAAVRAGGLTARQPSFDHTRSDDPSYQAEYLTRLLGAAEEVKADLAEVATRVANHGSPGGGRADWRREPKGRRRAEDKVREYNNDASLLTDLAAAKVEFDNLDDVYAALKRLSEDRGVEIIRCVDRFVRPQQSGYRDIQMLLRMSTGHVAEFRLHLAALDRVAEWEHALFEVRRDLKAVAEEEARPMSAKEIAIRNGLLTREQEFFWHALMSTIDAGGAEK